MPRYRAAGTTIHMSPTPSMKTRKGRCRAKQATRICQIKPANRTLHSGRPSPVHLSCHLPDGAHRPLNHENRRRKGCQPPVHATSQLTWVQNVEKPGMQRERLTEPLLENRVPTKRTVEGKSIGDVAAFLGSDAGRCATGVCLLVNEGRDTFDVSCTVAHGRSC